MARYRDALPQLAHRPFLTDTGLETTLVFHDGYELPHFAAVTLLREQAGRARLDRYFLEHAQVAAQSGVGFISSPRLGGPVQTGDTCWATPPMHWPRRTESLSTNWSVCGLTWGKTRGTSW